MNQSLSLDELTLKSDVINTNSTANTGHLILRCMTPTFMGLIRLLLLIKKPNFEWYVVRGGCKNRHQKGIKCLKEIGL